MTTNLSPPEWLRDSLGCTDAKPESVWRDITANRWAAFSDDEISDLSKATGRGPIRLGQEIRAELGRRGLSAPAENRIVEDASTHA